MKLDRGNWSAIWEAFRKTRRRDGVGRKHWGESAHTGAIGPRSTCDGNGSTAVCNETFEKVKRSFIDVGVIRALRVYHAKILPSSPPAS